MHGLNLVHSHSTMMGRLNAIDIALLDGDRIKTYITKKKIKKKSTTTKPYHHKHANKQKVHLAHLPL